MSDIKKYCLTYATALEIKRLKELLQPENKFWFQPTRLIGTFLLEEDKK